PHSVPPSLSHRPAWPGSLERPPVPYREAFRVLRCDEVRRLPRARQRQRTSGSHLDLWSLPFPRPSSLSRCAREGNAGRRKREHRTSQAKTRKGTTDAQLFLKKRFAGSFAGYPPIIERRRGENLHRNPQISKPE